MVAVTALTSPVAEVTDSSGFGCSIVNKILIGLLSQRRFITAVIGDRRLGQAKARRFSVFDKVVWLLEFRLFWFAPWFKSAPTMCRWPKIATKSGFDSFDYSHKSA